MAGSTSIAAMNISGTATKMTFRYAADRFMGDRSFDSARKDLVSLRMTQPSVESLLQRMFEFAQRMAHGEHRARRLAHDVLGNAADDQVREASASVGAHHDQVRVLRL